MATECTKCNKQDLANNNHLFKLEEKTKQLSLKNVENEGLFDESIFERISLEKLLFKYEKLSFVKKAESGGCYFNIGDNLIVRGLRRDDFEKNYMGLMGQLTVAGDMNKEKFERRYDQMKTCFNTYFICVVEDLEKRRVVASVTHVFEQKFFRGASARGRIEDVVVDEKYRGKRLSKLLIDLARQISQLLGCYKLSLECKDDLKPFYQRFGFDLEECQNYLCQRF